MALSIWFFHFVTDINHCSKLGHLLLQLGLLQFQFRDNEDVQSHVILKTRVAAFEGMHVLLAKHSM